MHINANQTCDLTVKSHSEHSTALIEKLGRLIKSNLNERFAKLPISMRDLLILKLIYINELQSNMITSSEISRKMGISRSAISQFVSSLQKRGYIISKADMHDKRKTYLYISDSAKEIIISFNDSLSADIDTIQREMGTERFELLLKLASEACGILSQKKAN